MLNNDIYVSGTVISKPGNYELSIRGIGNYLEKYNFTITSNLEGIVNDHTYNEPVEISFNGDAYLNNQFVTSPLVVSDVGDYILKIKGENNYLETYYFQIETENYPLQELKYTFSQKVHLHKKQRMPQLRSSEYQVKNN